MKKEKLKKKLVRAHIRVIEHPYRVTGKGNMVSYRKVLYNLLEAFHGCLTEQYPDDSQRRGNFYHSFATEFWYLGSGSKEKQSERMIRIERIIVQIHKYIDTGMWDEYALYIDTIYGFPVKEWITYEYCDELPHGFKISDQTIRSVGEKLLKTYSKVIEKFDKEDREIAEIYRTGHYAFIKQRIDELSKE